jgi:hypothetical protein
MRPARLRRREVMKKQAVKKHSIEISFPKAGAEEAGSFAKSLHEYLTSADLKQSGIAIALTSPIKTVGTPMVKLEFAPASTAALATMISKWHERSDADSIQVKLSGGRTFEKKRHLPDDDFRQEMVKHTE